MANVTDSVSCAACGRELPPQQGRGRRRRYCDARCRDAARRARVRNVNNSLTDDGRHDYVYGVAADDAAGQAGPLAGLAAAREQSAAAAAALQAAVDRARAAGHSWREIGDVLQTTRQAAFQRFGRPIDPRTYKPMTRQTLPGAEDKAIEILGCIIEGRWEDARRDFGEKMLEAVSADRIALAWAQTVAHIGSYERMGEPLVFPANEATVMEIPLFFEAGDCTGQVTFDHEGQVIGLFLRPAPS